MQRLASGPIRPKMLGNFTLTIEGDEETKAYLHDSHAWVNRMMTDISDDIAEHARDELMALGPGRIGTELIDMDHAREFEPGVIEAMAGVKPDAGEEMFRGLGSNPADFPIYVEVGTGIYGPEHRSIVMPPGRVMAFDWDERRVITPYIEGQEPQRYAERSYQNTVHWVPARLARSDILPEGGT